MKPHNTKTESAVRNESVRVIGSKLVDAEALSITVDEDKGSDPYNSTGQHVILKSKLDEQD